MDFWIFLCNSFLSTWRSSCMIKCGDRLLACLAYCAIFYHNVQWGRRFTYLHMHLSQSLFVLVYAYAARRSCAAIAGRRPSFRPGFTCLLSFDCGHVTTAVFELRARFLYTSQVRRCLIKIDSAVNLGETPSSEFVQCVLWVIRLTKTVSRSAVLFATVCHCRELSDKRYAHHIQLSSECFWLSSIGALQVYFCHTGRHVILSFVTVVMIEFL